MKAVANILQHLAMDLDDTWPDQGLRAVDPLAETRELYTIGEKTLAFIYNKTSGEARWDTIFASTDHTRIILSPDEGGRLFCGYVHLANAGSAVGFIRDELLPGLI